MGEAGVKRVLFCNLSGAGIYTERDIDPHLLDPTAVLALSITCSPPTWRCL